MNPQIRRLLLDLGPLFLFFLSFEFAGIFTATGIFMAAVLATLLLGWHLEKRLSPIPLVTAVLVVIFGGLTLYLRNDVFIKMKPTVLYTIFGATLLGGLFFNRLFIKYVFTDAFDLTEKGWRGLTWRWGVFFLTLAVLNEAVWRNTTTATWVAFKVWGIMSLIFLFALAQTPFLLKHHNHPEN
ncbi:MAG TPA: septation protein A [Rhizomicrobium sp.]|jgi:intracellular septation protein|nr:septation protein A [Rhizomicrobium sp.]